MITINMEEILRLSVDDRIRLVQQIWESIAADNPAPVLSRAERTEIQRRVDAYRRDPSIGIPAEDVFREIEERLG